jgi:hypothetical protein
MARIEREWFGVMFTISEDGTVSADNRRVLYESGQNNWITSPGECYTLPIIECAIALHHAWEKLRAAEQAEKAPEVMCPTRWQEAIRVLNCPMYAQDFQDKDRFRAVLATLCNMGDPKTCGYNGLAYLTSRCLSWLSDELAAREAPARQYGVRRNCVPEEPRQELPDGYAIELRQGGVGLNYKHCENTGKPVDVIFISTPDICSALEALCAAYRAKGRGE